MFPSHSMGTKRMDLYGETRPGLFWLDDDQNSLSDLTSLLLATVPGFCTSAERSAGKREPCLSARIAWNARTADGRSHRGQQGRRKGWEEYHDFRGKPEVAGLWLSLTEKLGAEGTEETLWCLASTERLWWLAALLVVLCFFKKLFLKHQMLIPFGSGVWRNEPLPCGGRGYRILTQSERYLPWCTRWEYSVQGSKILTLKKCPIFLQGQGNA